MSAPVLDELRKWVRLVDEAKEATEPLYVTHEELEELRRLAARMAGKEPLNARLALGTIGQFIGLPVIVDDERATARRQEARSRAEEELSFRTAELEARLRRERGL